MIKSAEKLESVHQFYRLSGWFEPISLVPIVWPGLPRTEDCMSKFLRATAVPAGTAESAY